MSSKHHRRHNRSRSNYPARLAARGESSATVRMPFIARTGHKFPTAEAMLKSRKGESDDYPDE